MKNAEKIVYTTFEEASKKNLEPILVLALIDNESRFQQHIKSPIGAVGLTQVVPKYHQDKIDELKKTEGIDIFSIKGNIKVGTQILRDYINVSDGNLQKALQMYNGNIRDKNKKYSSKIFSKMKEYEKI
jgi:soluble lytic murein transglycosylase-like protein